MPACSGQLENFMRAAKEKKKQQVQKIQVYNIIMMINLPTEFNVDYMDQPTDIYSF